MWFFTKQTGVGIYNTECIIAMTQIIVSVPILTWLCFWQNLSLLEKIAHILLYQHYCNLNYYISSISYLMEKAPKTSNKNSFSALDFCTWRRNLKFSTSNLKRKMKCWLSNTWPTKDSFSNAFGLQLKSWTPPPSSSAIAIQIQYVGEKAEQFLKNTGNTQIYVLV